MASILGRAVLLNASVPVPQFLTHTAGSVVMKMGRSGYPSAPAHSIKGLYPTHSSAWNC